MAGAVAVQCGPLILHPTLSRPVPHVAPVSARTLWKLVPLEIIVAVASKLTRARDLASLALVNRTCRLAAAEQHLWRRLCLDRFRVPRDARPACWRELYRFNHEAFQTVMGGMGGMGGMAARPLPGLSLG